MLLMPYTLVYEGFLYSFHRIRPVAYQQDTWMKMREVESWREEIERNRDSLNTFSIISKVIRLESISLMSNTHWWIQVTNLRNQYLFGSFRWPFREKESRRLQTYVGAENEEVLGVLQEKIVTPEKLREGGRCGSQVTSRGVDPGVVWLSLAKI